MACFLGWALAWLAGPMTARAHEVKEMTIDARVHEDRIDLILVASNHMAAAILAGPGGRPQALNAETFAALRPALEESGRQLCVLTSGEETPRRLAPVAIDVLLAQEGEVQFFIAYPPAPDGALCIEAAVLGRVEPGHVVNLRVLDTKRKLLAAKALTRGDASLLVPVTDQATKTTPD